jgi:hypothetical protein
MDCFTKWADVYIVHNQEAGVQLTNLFCNFWVLRELHSKSRTEVMTVAESVMKPQIMQDSHHDSASTVEEHFGMLYYNSR